MVPKPRSIQLRVVPGPAPPNPDDELVRAVRNGETLAAAAFYDRLSPVVARVLGRLLGGRDPDYDDLAQQAMIELVLGLDRYRGSGPLEAWASVVVARVAFHRLRRRKLERRLFAVELPEVPERADRRAAASITHRGTLRRIQRHFDAMDANKLWAYLLHDVHGYDLDEVATITGVSRAAAQSRLVRGRRELHERIARDQELSGVLDDLDEQESS